MTNLKDQVVEINGNKTIVTTENNHKLSEEEIKELEKITQDIITKLETNEK